MTHTTPELQVTPDFNSNGFVTITCDGCQNWQLEHPQGEDPKAVNLLLRDHIAACEPAQRFYGKEVAEVDQSIRDRRLEMVNESQRVVSEEERYDSVVDVVVQEIISGNVRYRVPPTATLRDLGSWL